MIYKNIGVAIMSSVIAMIYNDTICLASDCRAIDQATQEMSDDNIKQITVNNNVAIGFAGSGFIAQRMIEILSNPDNSDILSRLEFEGIHKALDDILLYELDAGIDYPDEESRHISALICGINSTGNPEIVYWKDGRIISKINQSKLNHFTAFILNPPDLSRDTCNDVLWHSALKYEQSIIFDKIATDYFNVISTMSKFVSDSFTIWIYPVNDR